MDRSRATQRAQTGTRATRHATRKVATFGTVLGTALALIGLAGGTTLALYATQATTRIEAIQAGDFNLTMGQLTWKQVTPGVKNPVTSATATTAFRSMPGDVFEIKVPATTLLLGDNLAGDLELNVSYAPGSGDQPITATFHVEDASGVWVAPLPTPDPSNPTPPEPADVPVGTAVSVANLLGDDAGVTTEWTVVVRVEVGGDYRWVTPTSAPSAKQWSVGTVSASLKQVRPWEGTP